MPGCVVLLKRATDFTLVRIGKLIICNKTISGTKNLLGVDRPCRAKCVAAGGPGSNRDEHLRNLRPARNEVEKAQSSGHPRLRSIAALAHNAEGPWKTADQVEELLIQERRQLGSATLHHWAAQAEARVSAELKQQDPSVLSRKKKR
jgi:hypothetical protein